MAQTISVVDPWTGMYKGVETLRQAASAADERKLNELKMAQAKLQLDEAQRAAQDKQAQRELARRLAAERKDVTTPGYNSLADVQAYNDAVRKSNAGLPVMWQDQATAPVPAGGQGITIPSLNNPALSPQGLNIPRPEDGRVIGLSGANAIPTQGPAAGLGSVNTPATAPGGAYGVFDRNMAEKQAEQDRLDALNEKAIAAQQASGLKTANAQTTQVPLSTLEKAQRMADLQMQQGDLAGSLATMKAGIDVTTQIPAATQKITSDIMRQGYNLIAAGKSAEEAKAAMVDYAKRTYPAELIPGIENIRFTPGGVGIIQAPGGVITTEYDAATGSTKFSYHKVDDHMLSGGLDGLAAKNRAAVLMKADPTLTQNAAMARAADEIRKENNQAKQANIQLRIDAAGGAGGMGKAQKTDFVDADGTPLNFYSQTGQYLRPDGSAPSQVVKRPPAAVAESAGATTQLINEIRDVKNIAKSVTTGPVAGRVGSTAQTFGAASDQFTDLNSKLQNVHNVMLKLRSGQAVTETEYRRFVREFPTVNDPPAVFQRKADNAINNLQSSLAARGQSLQTTGFAAPGTQQRPLTPKAGTARPISQY